MRSYFWTVLYFDVKTGANKYRTFDFLEELQEFIEDHFEKVKEKLPLQTMDDSFTIFPPYTDLLASDVLKGKYNYSKFKLNIDDDKK